jgi:hypothetical protein
MICIGMKRLLNLPISAKQYGYADLLIRSLTLLYLEPNGGQAGPKDTQNFIALQIRLS